MPTVFCSTEDKASFAIAGVLKESFSFQEKGTAGIAGKQYPLYARGGVQMVLLDCLLYETNFLSAFPKGDLFIFASRHSSSSGKPCYTVHSPGNFDADAGLGGNPSELQLTSAYALDFLLQKLGGFELPVVREGTHHGPTCLSTPSVFVELGSTESEWMQRRLAEPVAQAIVDCLVGYASSKRVALGFGGTHYCNAFENLDFAFSHIASKHVLDSIGSSMVRQAVEKTVEKVDKAFLDWKGSKKPQRDKLIAAFEENGLEWERV